MMPGIQVKEVCDALNAAFSIDELGMMITMEMGLSLDELVSTQAPKPVVIFKLVTAMEQRGLEVELIQAVYRVRPQNPKIQHVYEMYGLAPDLTVIKAEMVGMTFATAVAAAASKESGLQRLVRENIPFFDINIWSRRMPELQMRVCRIELGDDAAGTGFLVGPEVVLTNFHVVREVLGGDFLENEVACRFDYMKLKDGSVQAGKLVRLHPEKGVLLSAPMHPAEETMHPETAVPAPDQMDFALLRLAEPMGDLSPTGQPGATPRGWEVLPPATLPVRMKENDCVIIVQHPLGDPMKLAIGMEGVIGYNDGKTRLRYRTNTEGGSSGSPVYTGDWKLAGLHHLGDPVQEPHKPGYNQAVVLTSLRDFITTQGFGAFLGS